MPMGNGNTCMQLPARAMADKSLNANDLRVLMRLGEIYFQFRQICIGQTQLGQQVGGLTRKTVNAIIGRLEEKGYLIKNGTHPDYHTLMIDLVDAGAEDGDTGAGDIGPDDGGPDDEGGPGGGQGLPLPDGAAAEAVACNALGVTDPVPACNAQGVTGGVTPEGDRGCNPLAVTDPVTPPPVACNPHGGDRPCNPLGGTQGNNLTKKPPSSPPAGLKRRSGPGAGRAGTYDPTPCTPAPLCGAGGLPREAGSAVPTEPPSARQPEPGGGAANAVRTAETAAGSGAGAGGPPDAAALWARVLAGLRRELGAAAVRSWLEGWPDPALEPGQDGPTLRLAAPTPFKRDWVTSHYAASIAAHAARALGLARPVPVRIGVAATAAPRRRRA